MKPPCTDISAEVRIYTLSGCLSCAFARRRLRRHGVGFEEVRCEDLPDFRQFLLETTGGSTVPQVFIDEEPVGGSDDLAALDRNGALAPRLRREPFPVLVVKRRFPPFLKRYRLWVVGTDGEILGTERAKSKAEAERIAEDLKERHLV